MKYVIMINKPIVTLIDGTLKQAYFVNQIYAGLKASSLGRSIILYLSYINKIQTRKIFIASSTTKHPVAKYRRVA